MVSQAKLKIWYRRRSQMDNKILSHVSWKFQYHIVIIPKSGIQKERTVWKVESGCGRYNFYIMEYKDV